MATPGFFMDCERLVGSDSLLVQQVGNDTGPCTFHVARPEEQYPDRVP